MGILEVDGVGMRLARGIPVPVAEAPPCVVEGAELANGCAGLSDEGVELAWCLGDALSPAGVSLEGVALRGVRLFVLLGDEETGVLRPWELPDRFTGVALRLVLAERGVTLLGVVEEVRGGVVPRGGVIPRGGVLRTPPDMGGLLRVRTWPFSVLPLGANVDMPSPGPFCSMALMSALVRPAAERNTDR